MCGLFVSVVRADTIGPFATTTPIPATLTDWNGSLSFPKFNSALGTLTSVELDLSSGLTRRSPSPTNRFSGPTEPRTQRCSSLSRMPGAT